MQSQKTSERKVAEEMQTSSSIDTAMDTLLKVVCCDREFCQQCCDSLTGAAEKKRLTKDDIQHPVITHQPITKLDSVASSSSSSNKGRSRFSSSGYYSNWSSQNSPVFPRDRTDSDNSYSSRKDSTSSSIPDSPASFGKKTAVTPLIDMKPIEFWAANRAESVQPRPPKRRLPSESEISVEDFNPDIYDMDDLLTDEQKLARYKLGQVHFGVQYEIPTKSLIVRVIEARELPPPYIQDSSRQDMAHSNPYCRVCLLQDQKHSKQTSVQRKTQDPEWNESFRFEVPFKEVQRCTLEITVKDFDKFSRHCSIGQVTVALDQVNLVRGNHVWKPLSPSVKEESDLGEILLSLSYLPAAGRLNVDVIKAKQLLQTDLLGGSDPYVKVTLCHLDKTIKTRKTSSKKNPTDPIFNETLSFNISPEVYLEDSSLHVSVCDQEVIGRVVLAKTNTGTKEMNHWKTMLQAQRGAMAQWHSLSPQPEADDKSSTSCIFSQSDVGE